MSGIRLSMCQRTIRLYQLPHPAGLHMRVRGRVSRGVRRSSFGDLDILVFRIQIHIAHLIARSTVIRE